MTLRWLAVVNPSAGAMRHSAARILAALEAAEIPVVFTQAPGEAQALAASASEYDGMVAVGGDGTVSEVLSGMDRTRQRLAVVPAGTGNCLARDLGVNNVERAVAAIKCGQVRSIDVACARLQRSDDSTLERHVASTAGVGYAAEVARVGKLAFARLAGHAYSAAAAIVRPRRRRIEWRSDEQEEFVRVSTTGLLINNTRCIGSATPFPQALLDDGQLDAFLFQRGWLRQTLHNLEMVTGVAVCSNPRPLRLRQLQLRFAAPEVVMLDGELFGQVRSLSLRCEPARVACAVLR